MAAKPAFTVVILTFVQQHYTRESFLIEEAGVGFYAVRVSRAISHLQKRTGCPVWNFHPISRFRIRWRRVALKRSRGLIAQMSVGRSLPLQWLSRRCFRSLLHRLLRSTHPFSSLSGSKWGSLLTLLRTPISMKSSRHRWVGFFPPRLSDLLYTTSAWEGPCEDWRLIGIKRFCGLERAGLGLLIQTHSIGSRYLVLRLMISNSNPAQSQP